MDRLFGNDLEIEEEVHQEQEQEEEQEYLELSDQEVLASSSRKSTKVLSNRHNRVESSSKDQTERVTQNSQDMEVEQSEQVFSGFTDQPIVSKRGRRVKGLTADLSTSLDNGKEIQGLNNEETTSTVQDSRGQKKRNAETYKVSKQKRPKIYHFDGHKFTKSDLQCICSIDEGKKQVSETGFVRYLHKIMVEMKLESYKIHYSAAELLRIAVENEITDLFFIAGILSNVRKKSTTDLLDFNLATLIKKTLGEGKTLSMTSSIDLKKILEGYSLSDSTYNLRENSIALKEKSEQIERIRKFYGQISKEEAKSKKKETKTRKNLRKEAKPKKIPRNKEACSGYLLNPEDEL